MKKFASPFGFKRENKLALEFMECEKANALEKEGSEEDKIKTCCNVVRKVNEKEQHICKYVEFTVFYDNDDMKKELEKIDEREKGKRRKIERRCVHELSAQVHMCREQDYRPEVLFPSEFSCIDGADCHYMGCKEGRKCEKKNCNKDENESCELHCTTKEDMCHHHD